MKQLFKTITVTLLLLIAPLYFSLPTNAQANLACDGLSVSSGGDCTPRDTEPTVDSVIKTALDILTFVAGAIAVIMIIIAGVKFVTSQGDSGKVASARSAVIFAIIGIIIVVLSQTIVFFVLRQATSTPTNPAPSGGSNRALPI